MKRTAQERRHVSTKEGEEALNVDISQALGKRLRKYVAEVKGRTQKATVSAALDDYLKKRGA